MKERKNSILVIEDDLNNINLLIRTFGEDYHLYVADNGSEGLQLAMKHRPDVILLDIIMPGIDGLEVCDRIKEHEKLQHIPIIFMTALADIESMEKGFEHGGADYIAKPFRLEEVKARVRAHILMHHSFLKKCMREKEEEIRRALDDIRKKNEEADRLKTAFLANLSHEIRTPLSAIVGFCELMRNKEYPFEMRSQYLDIIRNNADQLLYMVNDILDISMLSSGQLALAPEEVKVHELLRDLLQYFSDTPGIGPAQNVSLKLTLPRGVKEVTVTADHKRLRQVLHNLLHNACKFTREGEITTGYEMGARNELTFFVEDTGIGISPEKQKSIFDVFWQGEAHYTREYGGTGMGLTIVRKLLDLMGGTISLDSAMGEGTSVRVTVPFETVQPTKGEINGDEASFEVQRGNHGLI